ncbi:DUF805 domain-containing protein [Mesorhizobium sp. YC-39]|uniref:DUF805 domain-containing protein n=1 Tax=unclassified Mesorhizobium TaxID=325217 RepID=UPI0021E9426B|nr:MULTISPECIES: DUF805 domain-containing protein [unclassified Mesorhizobium]MCV3206396.1 DUF805 domain-containing protein [Mesorhizobium sp. YC-2]MCV3227204.1 DUF805 domain-containing protein [Mesorhizobium sp. YC-39]
MSTPGPVRKPRSTNCCAIDLSARELTRLSDRPQFLWLFFSLSGRLSPSAYALTGLLVILAQFFPLYQIARVEAGSAAGETWALVFWIVLLVSSWASFAVTAKRFHDFGKPTYFALISLIIGPILLIILACFGSDPGPNRYGKRTNAPAEP